MLKVVTALAALALVWMRAAVWTQTVHLVTGETIGRMLIARSLGADCLPCRSERSLRK